MAGLKLKSGADFCNFEAFRMRLHNAGEDPTSDFGVGQIYFNTSDTSVGSARHVRLYDGTKFRSLAYLDDVDSRIKTIEDMLSVDTAEGVVSTWNEIQEFLDSVQEGTDLMDLLNDKLSLSQGGRMGASKAIAWGSSGTNSYIFGDNNGLYISASKLQRRTADSKYYDILDTSGGTLTGNLLIGAPDNTSYRYLQFARSGYGSRINIADGNLYVPFGGIDANGGLTATKAFSLGNNGIRYAPDGKTYHDILTSAGGTLTDILFFEFANPRIAFKSDANTTLGAVGFNDGVLSAHITADNKWYALLHSGNVGEYACKAININSDITDTDKAYVGRALSAWTNWGKATNNPNGVAYASGLTLSFAGNAFQIAKDAYDLGKLYVRMSNYQSDSIPSWSDWKTIAFTDSNVAGAYKLVTSTGEDAATVANDKIVTFGAHIRCGICYFRNNDGGFKSWFGRGSTSSDDIILQIPTANSFKVNTNGTQRFIINSSGNVTIGASDKAGTDYKFYVNEGKSLFYAWNNTTMSLGTPPSNSLLVGLDVGLGMWYQSGVGSVLQSERFDGTATAYNLLLQPLGGNVLIGTTTDNGSGAKLQVNGGITGGSFKTNGRYALGDYFKIEFYNTAMPMIQTYNANLLLNPLSGNVLIGTTTDDGAKLQVGGDISIPNNHYISFNNAAKTPLYQLWMTGNDVFFVGRGSVENGHESVYCGKTIRFATGDSAWNNSASIDENGNLHVKGNIIADGEVSAGGAGEEGGGSSSGGGGAFHSANIAVGATQTTIAHGLGTDDIVVSIYEKDGVSGRWSIILTDVEIVDANNIIVSFGSATNVEHKVVIMGAVA